MITENRFIRPDSVSVIIPAYNAEKFILEDEQLRNARFNLIKAVQITLVNGLTILGVSAPESM